MINCHTCHDIELGLPKIEEEDTMNEKYNEEKNDTIININSIFNLNLFSHDTKRETNTKLFKLMEECAYIMLEDPNIIEYFVYEERKFIMFNHYIIKYYLKHENNIFYKIERKYHPFTLKLIEKEKISEYHILNELIYYDHT